MYDACGMHLGDGTRRGWYGGTFGDRPAWSEPWSAVAPAPPPKPVRPSSGGGFWQTVRKVASAVVEVGLAVFTYENRFAPGPVLAGGHVYGWRTGSTLMCWDALTGGVRWAVDPDSTGPVTQPAPAVGEGVVIVADRGVKGYDADSGRLLWTREITGVMASALLMGGAAYVIGEYDTLHVLQISTGRTLWNTRIHQSGTDASSSSPMFCAPASDGQKLYAGGNFGLVALDPATRRAVWTSRNEQWATPAIAGGCVYTTQRGEDDGAGGGYIEAIRADKGRRIWRRDMAGAGTLMTPAIADGVLIAGDNKGGVHGIDAATGRSRWHYATGAGIWGSPATAASTVFVPSRDHFLYALDLGTGRLHWRYEAQMPLVAAPVIGYGFVYVSDVGGTLYAIDAATGRGSCTASAHP